MLLSIPKMPKNTSIIQIWKGKNNICDVKRMLILFRVSIETNNLETVDWLIHVDRIDKFFSSVKN